MNDDDVLLDEFHLAIYVPKTLPTGEVFGIRGGLASETFRQELLKVVRRLLRRGPIFFNVEIEVTR